LILAAITPSYRSRTFSSLRLVEFFRHLFERPPRSGEPRHPTPETLEAPSTKLDLGNLAVRQAAHDLRNLLTVMAGCAESMRLHVPRGKADVEFDELRRAGQRASILTRELIMGARPRSARRTQVDLNDLVASMAERLSWLVGDKLLLRLRLSSEPAVIVADAAEIERILMNLVLNSRDAMPFGGVLSLETSVIIEVSERPTEVGSLPWPYVRLKVCDSGCGMPPAVKSRIFEPYFSTKETGTGLGLSSVAYTVRQLGGTSSVQSQPGVGTCVTIRLPLDPTVPQPA
jgi:signal transduction histidine kinase